MTYDRNRDGKIDAKEMMNCFTDYIQKIWDYDLYHQHHFWIKVNIEQKNVLKIGQAFNIFAAVIFGENVFYK